MAVGWFRPDYVFDPSGFDPGGFDPLIYIYSSIGKYILCAAW